MDDGSTEVADMRTRIGALALLLAPVQYLLAQVIAGAVWRPPYSWRENFISDLGNTACGTFAVPHGTPANVCSPLHPVMNASFVASGLLLIAAVVLLWPHGRVGRLGAVGAGLFLLSGLGKIGTGLVPENTSISLHLLAALNVPIGGVALLLVSRAVRRRYPRQAIFGVTMAAIGLVGSVLSSAAQVAGPALLFGFGPGGMERVASYPVNVWMVVAGVVLLRSGVRRAADSTDPTHPSGLGWSNGGRRADAEHA